MTVLEEGVRSGVTRARIAEQRVADSEQELSQLRRARLFGPNGQQTVPAPDVLTQVARTRRNHPTAVAYRTTNAPAFVRHTASQRHEALSALAKRLLQLRQRRFAAGEQANPAAV